MDVIANTLPRHLGRYEIVGKLATGGMAEILLGRLTGPNGFERPVVVKRILPHLRGLPELTDMFLDEGRIAARIGHPNVAQVQELTEQADGELYLVMEYLEGEASAALARRARARGRKLDPALCAYIIAEAAAGLHAAHDLRSPDGVPLDVVHRDISPQNLFISYDGTVKVLDFGIAKAAERITTTEAGMLKGKFAYMSPEQAAGRALDKRSDLFSLGIVLYELSTQRRLFKRSSPTETLRAVLEDPIVPPSVLDPDYPASLERICLKALSRSAADRYQSAHDMRRDLLEALRGFGPSMPEEALAELMCELFPDRIELKKTMLSRICEGLTPSHVPAGDIAEEDLPTVDGQARNAIRAGQAQRTLRRRSAWAALAVFAVVVVGFGVAALLLVYDRSRSQEHPRAELREASERAVSPPAESLVVPVAITVDSDPSGALLSVDGVARGTTPTTLRFEHPGEPAELRLVHEGYLPLIEQIRTDVNQQVRLSLSAAPDEEPEVAPRSRRSGRRRRRPLAPPVEEASAPPETSPPESSPERAFRPFL